MDVSGEGSETIKEDGESSGEETKEKGEVDGRKFIAGRARADAL